MKTTWKGIKQIISTKPIDLLTPSKIILEDGSTVTDANEIANSFNNFFVDIGISLSNQVTPTSTSPLTLYSILTDILKKVGGIIAKPLELLRNVSFSTGAVPDNLKIARVIALYKSGPRTCLSNYRPVSLLSIFHKILEKLVYNRLTKFFDRNSTISDSLFGLIERSILQSMLCSYLLT